MKKEHKIVNLGLQGGGAHGAFGWGVLDYLLEDGRLDIEGISATSAGSMNAVVLAHGMLNNNKDTARQALNDFWKAISETQKLGPLQNGFEVPGFSEDEFSLDTSLSYIWL